MFDSGSRARITGSRSHGRVALEPQDLLSQDSVDASGVLVATIDASTTGFTAEEAESAGFMVEDDRADTVGGFVFAPAGLDLAEPLSATGVSVLADSCEIMWGMLGLGGNENIAEFAAYTNDWGIGAGVAVHELLR